MKARDRGEKKIVVYCCSTLVGLKERGASFVDKEFGGQALRRGF